MKSIRLDMIGALHLRLDTAVYNQLRSDIHRQYGMPFSATIERFNISNLLLLP